MPSRQVLALIFACALSVCAAPPKTPTPPLEPGEALALAAPDGTVYLFGDAQRESSMGSLAELVWLKLEGSEWSASDLTYKCTGAQGPLLCSAPKGHGRVNLAKALLVGCDLAFLNWMHQSALDWPKDYGEGPGRFRLEDGFGAFLGRRMPAGEGLPELTLDWVGRGPLLRASPETILKWLVDPAQDDVLRLSRRLLLSFLDETFRANAWWIYIGSAAAEGAPGTRTVWAIGGNGSLLAVLRLADGRTPADGMARFRAVLGLPKGK